MITNHDGGFALLTRFSIALVLILNLSACGGKKGGSQPDTPPDVPPVPQDVKPIIDSFLGSELTVVQRSLDETAKVTVTWSSQHAASCQLKRMEPEMVWDVPNEGQQDVDISQNTDIALSCENKAGSTESLLIINMVPFDPSNTTKPKVLALNIPNEVEYLFGMIRVQVPYSWASADADQCMLHFEKANGEMSAGTELGPEGSHELMVYFGRSKTVKFELYCLRNGVRGDSVVKEVSAKRFQMANCPSGQSADRGGLCEGLSPLAQDDCIARGGLWDETKTICTVKQENLLDESYPGSQLLRACLSRSEWLEPSDDAELTIKSTIELIEIDPNLEIDNQSLKTCYAWYADVMRKQRLVLQPDFLEEPIADGASIDLHLLTGLPALSSLVIDGNDAYDRPRFPPGFLTNASLEAIKDIPNLRSLVLASTEINSLQSIAGIQLEYLSIESKTKDTFTDFASLEHFPQLQNLNLKLANFRENDRLDHFVSSLKALNLISLSLEDADLSAEQLSHLVKHQQTLTSFSLIDSDLSGELDLEGWESIKDLTIADSDMTSFVLRQAPNLNHLNIANNEVIAWQTPDSKDLKTLKIWGNQFETLVIQDLESLTEIYLSRFYCEEGNDICPLGQLKAADHSIGQKDSPLRHVTIKNLPALSSFGLAGHKAVESVTLENITGLGHLSLVYNSQLSKLDVRQSPNLSVIKAQNNRLSELNLDPSSKDKLKALNLAHNDFVQLDIHDYPSLTQLFVSSTGCELNTNCYASDMDIYAYKARDSIDQLQGLVLSHLPALKHFSLGGGRTNQIETLELGENLGLKEVSVVRLNSFKNLQITASQPALERIVLQNLDNLSPDCGMASFISDLDILEGTEADQFFSCRFR